MAQRFNAPPGWQVPDGFVPPTGWQPDPSWPPAPAGWNFWVDDAAPAGAPAGAAAGAPAGAPAGAATAAPGEQGSGFGPAAHPGGYGDPSSYSAAQAPGSANVALAQKQIKDNKRMIYIGFGVAAAALLVFVVSFAIAASSPTGGTYYFPWYFMLIGIAIGIRGAIATSKAKKALAQLNPSGGLAGAYANGPASSAPVPPGGPWQGSGAPGVPSGPGASQPQRKPRDEGRSSLGDLYR